MTLGEFLVVERKARGMTKRALAQRAQISEAALYGIEHGTIASPRVFVVAALAEVLGLSLDHLLQSVDRPAQRPYLRRGPAVVHSVELSNPHGAK